MTDTEYFYLADEEDKAILMHRDAHFGGSFDVMLEYYREEKKGAVLPSSIAHIEALAAQEKALQQNIAPLILTGADAEKVAAVRMMYQSLQALYEQLQGKKNIATAISDLIVTEDEDATKEIDAVISYGQEAVPYLINIIESADLQDPLFPGYGYAPLYAAKALGVLKAEKAVQPLFLLLKADDFEYGEAAIEALVAIGAPAKQFLLRQVQSKPIHDTNVLAASALNYFDDEEVVRVFKELLQDEDVKKNKMLVEYLIIGQAR